MLSYQEVIFMNIGSFGLGYVIWKVINPDRSIIELTSIMAKEERKIRLSYIFS